MRFQGGYAVGVPDMGPTKRLGRSTIAAFEESCNSGAPALVKMSPHKHQPP